MTQGTKEQTSQSSEPVRWDDERVDNLAALVMVTEEQLADRERAAAGLATDTPRVRELIQLVFGDEDPSVENYLDNHDALAA